MVARPRLGGPRLHRGADKLDSQPKLPYVLRVFGVHCARYVPLIATMVATRSDASPACYAYSVVAHPGARSQAGLGVVYKLTLKVSGLLTRGQTMGTQTPDFSDAHRHSGDPHLP